MTKFTMIKKAVFALVLATGLFACSNEEINPMLDINFTMQGTDQFDYAEVAFQQLFLYEGEAPNLSKSNLQQMNDQVLIGFQLAKGSTHDLTLQPHFEMQVSAIEADMDLYLHLTNSGLNQKVYKNLGDTKIFLDHPVQLLPNETYDVNIDMDLNDALVFQDTELYLDWSKVTASITKR